MTSTTSVEDLRALKELFEFFDADKNGSIEASELADVIRSIGQSPTEDTVRQLIREVDRDGDGKIQFNEFLEIMTRKIDLRAEQHDTVDDVLNSFRIFDKDLTGFVKTSDLEKVLTQRGEKLSKKEVKNMLALCDVTVDGYVHYETLVRTVQNASGGVNLMDLVKLKKDSSK
ncbi:calmodulin 1 [Salpingoeca rosetta]|uniref:Calmodulin 1 n=1 Tax=Salpingoeca rosetta (strain ATCC 50818 / BSB-021) TaxID=946362 RepID=F2UD46_SALR5|nr:calmodulin 1 [Salpingoeca rosetta]EGD74541.1 calmodulin 1 [Salpingoeca rosetta]|eukprot:XP_004992798.1 calmodulin 1 [Salpingoeca rosetta]